MDGFLEGLNKRYKIERNLGRVFKAFDGKRGIHVALKPIKIRSNCNGIPSGILREISLLKEWDHDNLVRLLDVVVTAENIAMVFEYLNSDLDKEMKVHSQPRDEHMVKVFLYQMLKGVAYSHSQRFMHQDINPWNILIDETTHVVKLCDFALARAFDARSLQSIELFKHSYRAPEVLLETDITCSADIWSLGCIFAEMVNKRTLFYELTPDAILTQILRLFGVPSENEWPGIGVLCTRMCGTVQPIGPAPDYHEMCRGLNPVGIDLLSQMLCMVPSGRITAHDALNHPYFSDVNLSLIGSRNNPAG